MEPRKPSKRIVCPSPSRAAYQEFWPEAEVTIRVTVIHLETWGQDSATYEIVAREPIDIREGHTREAIERAELWARLRCGTVAGEVIAGHPGTAGAIELDRMRREAWKR